MDIQRLQVVLADASGTGGDVCRLWAEKHGAVFERILDRALEFSDFPASRYARDSAYLLALRRIGLQCEKAERGNYLLIADVTGLRDDQINRLTNVIRRFGIPVTACVLSGSLNDMPQLHVRLPDKTDHRKFGYSGRDCELDIIGDVHGCTSELNSLLYKLGWSRNGQEWTGPGYRRIVFVGDIVDRGPDPLGSLEIVMSLCGSGKALCVAGNHDFQLEGWLKGKKIPTAHGMGDTQKVLSEASEDVRADVLEFLQSLPAQLVLDNGSLVVAHAGCPEKYQGIESDIASKECIFGTMLYKDENGLPVRDDWAARYIGAAVVVQGHVPVNAVTPVGNVWDIDTGCAFGGSLSALQYPEMVIKSVPALADYTQGHPTALRLAEERKIAEADNANYSAWPVV